jgi:hypothetical protein
VYRWLAKRNSSSGVVQNWRFVRFVRIKCTSPKVRRLGVVAIVLILQRRRGQMVPLFFLDVKGMCFYYSIFGVAADHTFRSHFQFFFSPLEARDSRESHIPSPGHGTSAWCRWIVLLEWLVVGCCEDPGGRGREREEREVVEVRRGEAK